MDIDNSMVIAGGGVMWEGGEKFWGDKWCIKMPSISILLQYFAEFVY